MRWVFVLLLGSGCGKPLHMQYDFGRAYTEAIVYQADLTRPDPDKVMRSRCHESTNIVIQIRKEVLESADIEPKERPTDSSRR